MRGRPAFKEELPSEAGLGRALTIECVQVCIFSFSFKFTCDLKHHRAFKSGFNLITNLRFCVQDALLAVTGDPE